MESAEALGGYTVKSPSNHATYGGNMKISEKENLISAANVKKHQTAQLPPPRPPAKLKPTIPKSPFEEPERKMC